MPGLFGRTRATRSPGEIPAPRSWPASASTVARRSAKVASRLPTPWTAIASGAPAASSSGTVAAGDTLAVRRHAGRLDAEGGEVVAHVLGGAGGAHLVGVALVAGDDAKGGG